MVFPIIPMTAAPASAQTDNGTVVTGDTLNGIKVRFRPAGSHKPLSINQDGDGSQNCVHLYYNGKSSHFYLQKADDDSYYINFYKYYTDAKPKTSGDCRLDVERSGGTDDSYYREGQVIHVVSGSSEAMNKRWQLIQQDDGTYYIRNKRSQLYWSLDDLSKPKTNNNKLVQREEPLKWEMEIVSDDNEKLKTIKPYDSTNFNYNDKPVTSLNWMGALPDNLRITDISIPGTHDAGTCWVHSDQDHSSDQRYYINELLNAGVRHLDIRTGLNDDKKVRIVHSDHHCLNKEGDDITMDELMGWITDFLDTNKTETVVFQVKMDKQGSECERKTFEYLKAMAQKENSYIWTGDHVPTLKEVRGKIVIISRLDLEDLGGEEKGYTFKTTLDGKPALWGLDCHNWRESKDHATDLAASGADFEVWTQDDFGHMAGEKKKYIKGALLGTDDRGNSTLDRYIDAKLNGKHAWVFNYTSTSSGQKHVPFDLCKEIHQWLYDRSEYDNPEKLVCGDTFTGVMAFDFIDEYMASFIYKTNFRRSYTTIHGISPDGEELVRPLTLYVGESEDAAKLLNETYTNILKKHFNANPYGMMAAANGSYLADVKTKNQEELDSAAARVSATLAGGTVPKDLYVTLLKPIEQVELDVSMPVCGSAVSGSDPQVSVVMKDASGCGAENAFITQSAGSDAAFEGAVEGGEKKPVRISLVPQWGYRFDDSCTVKSSNSQVTNSKVISGGELSVNASAQIPHDTSLVNAKSATCTENGAVEHYICNHCGKVFLEKKSEGDKSVLVEVDADQINIPAIGHNWGEWTVDTQATQEAEGLLKRTCVHEGCNAEETLKIPKLNHEHVLTHVPENNAAKCTETGNKEYWVCQQCSTFFDDAEMTKQISESDTLTGPGPHNWGDVKYLEVMYDSDVAVIAFRECEDGDHEESEIAIAEIDLLEPTCTEDGHQYKTAEFENEAFDDYHSEIMYPALGHKWDEGKVTKKPTCSSKGERVFTCKRCGETKTEEIPVDPNAHNIFTEEDESTNTATCNEGGRITVYEVCSICDEIIKTKRVKTPPLEHSWSAPVYVWSDDKSSVTATRSCERDGCSEEETETVSTTMRVLEESSCETPGSVVYDATFKNEEFDTQEQKVEVSAPGHKWNAGKVTKKPTAAAEGEKTFTCAVCNATKTETIPKLISIQGAKVSGVKVKTWTGKALTQKPTVKLSGKTLKNGTNYTVTYKNNKDVGKATLTITGKGSYTGAITKSFKINPKGTSIKKLKKAKKAVTVKWAKQLIKMSKSRITGYQIQLATNSKFTKGKKTVTVKGYKKVSKKVTKLKGKKKYYVRVRTYKTVSGVKYYSPWSKIKTVKTR